MVHKDFTYSSEENKNPENLLKGPVAKPRFGEK